MFIYIYIYIYIYNRYSMKVRNIFVYLLNHQSRISDITSTTSWSRRIELMVIIKPSLRSWKMFPVNPLVNPSFSKKLKKFYSPLINYLSLFPFSSPGSYFAPFLCFLLQSGIHNSFDNYFSWQNFTLYFILFRIKYYFSL